MLLGMSFVNNTKTTFEHFSTAEIGENTKRENTEITGQAGNASISELQNNKALSLSKTCN